MCIQCVSFECVAANGEITIQSKQFISERYSSLFHRPFCRSLLSAPKRITYVECDRLHSTPCQICISSELSTRLALSVFCKQESIDQNTPDFHQQIEVTWLDLFDQ